ncbi:MAG: SpoIIIAH-like family protein [Bacillales bacterium]|nr:SpoIIIAH-like family protein [Bacillales bacterium]
MINKRSLWFLTLFSLILVLSVYYITMPNEVLTDDRLNEEIKEVDLLTALRVESDNKISIEMEELKKIMNDLNVTVDERNNAFEQMKSLNITRGEEEKLENKVKEKYKIDSFIKITGNQIRVIVTGNKHDNVLANNIMRTIQEEYENQMYISIKFE